MIKRRSFFLFVLLLSLSVPLFAAVTETNLPTLSIAYVQDKSGDLSVNDLVTQVFTPISNQHSLSIDHDTVWYKVTITNPKSAQNTQLFLHNKLAYLSQNINIYELIKNEATIAHSYNLLDSNAAQQLTGSTLVYPITLFPNNTKTIFIRNKALVHQLIHLEIYDQKNSIQALINKNYYSNILISFLLALALYNAMLFFYNRHKEFLIYALYLLNAATGLFYLYGSVFHNFNFYGLQVYWLNTTAILVSLFLALFVQVVFETHKR